ncbi:MAG: hypothetical protein ACI8SI_000816 [Congregibacter sp.]
MPIKQSTVLIITVILCSAPAAAVDLMGWLKKTLEGEESTAAITAAMSWSAYRFRNR